MNSIQCGQIFSAALHGIDGVVVDIEVTILPGLPGFEIVGLGDSAVRESRNRVHAALRNSGYMFPSAKVTASYAPAWLHKTGSAFDLPLALAVLAASGQLKLPDSPVCAFGELSLTGEIRPVPGVICRLAACRERAYSMLILPEDNAAEGSVFSDLPLYMAAHLSQITAYFADKNQNTKRSSKKNQPPLINKQKSRTQMARLQVNQKCNHQPQVSQLPDLSQIAGQKQAIRALQLAAAGWHHLLMLGSPGCGKTTLARTLPALLPPLNNEQALTVTRIHSAAGRLTTQGLITEHPFRMPHHSISRAALIGGGLVPVPGEVSMAHQGILFLDELTAFDPAALDAMRQPLEEQQVHLYRLNHSFIYPADFLLIAAANPCRCGEYLEPDSSCTCTPEQVKRYLGKISGPLLDRFDVVIEMSRLKPYQLMQSVLSGKQGERHPHEAAKANEGKKTSDNCSEDDPLAASSAAIHKKVYACHQLQKERSLRFEPVPRLNARIGSDRLAEKLDIPRHLIRYTADLAQIFKLTARSYQKVLRLARTIADYDQNLEMRKDHIDEALQYRLRTK